MFPSTEIRQSNIYTCIETVKTRRTCCLKAVSYLRVNMFCARAIAFFADLLGEDLEQHLAWASETVPNAHVLEAP